MSSVGSKITIFIKALTIGYFVFLALNPVIQYLTEGIESVSIKEMLYGAEYVLFLLISSISIYYHYYSIPIFRKEEIKVRF